MSDAAMVRLKEENASISARLSAKNGEVRELKSAGNALMRGGIGALGAAAGGALDRAMGAEVAGQPSLIAGGLAALAGYSMDSSTLVDAGFGILDAHAYMLGYSYGDKITAAWSWGAKK